ncbi:MAG: long-chain fatty acid--CoA ligase [Sphingobium sp.]|uniref:AMP-dependent synthetase/ligase n=1 Tax=Sphingobium sp. TaxID=1912891 RepID=UPI000C47799C|nr:AMP-dependent synthetase/ligase [Sphingobium sp.]MBU0658108.1 AMP-dependent synthetase/ligase [Alphaproteobacteria bacterium]MBA4756036.1 long-chain fatty acid--CoA ligase [Sphingobium sp.]MBS89712.1 long-chain fatty acid--CoA ligase [Sphingobium sp.]MBU0867697.1 AMP-dependent synthetase/ligase [Alphaproteobacteria bacterium]MBU1794446.1 AMP-dependent synthetase/ligase [Alphaproteobacteria bacterium]
MFFTRAAERGDTPFLWRKSGGTWHPLSWNEVARRVAALSTALKSLGLKPGDPVMLVSENRPEFCIADLAIMAAGCITVPTYTTNTTRDHQHILTDSGARAVIVSTAKLAQALMPAVVRSQASFVIGMEPLRGAQGQATCHLWDDLIAAHPTDVAACAAAQTATRQDQACIIYTSGTGGAPRGVMQHHGAILLNAEGAGTIVAEDFGWGEETFLSFLPLSHAYEHSGGQFLPMLLGGQIYYAEGLEKLASNIEETRPTIMVVVPRLFEVLRARIIKSIEKQGKFPTWLMAQALRIGAKEQQGKASVLDLPLKALLARTLLPKIRARFGGRLKALVSGGAPLNPDVGLFFDAMGLTLLQGYGQTEAGPVVSCNRPSAGIAMDTVGPPLKGVEVKIADDGEILVRGELVMHGYWRNPAETEKVLKNGWLHTGDIGEFDAKGRIRITDRKKDLIVNDKGDNVSPQKIEGMLTLQNEIGQAMVHGDRRPYLVGLIVPDAEWTREWAQANGVVPADAPANPAYMAALRAAVDRVNADLSVIERVRRFILADEPFTIDNEEMTPSMKIRRHVIRKRYADRMDALYKA